MRAITNEVCGAIIGHQAWRKITMTTRKTATNEIAAVNATNETMPLWKALEDEGLLNCKRSSLFVACKNRKWLKDAIKTVRHPETGHKYAVIGVAEMNRYIAERRQGGGGGSHDGAKKHALWLSDEEVAVAIETLTAKFGRNIKIERLYKVKTTADATTTETTTDDESDVEGDDGDMDGDGVIGVNEDGEIIES